MNQANTPLIDRVLNETRIELALLVTVPDLPGSGEPALPFTAVTSKARYEALYRELLSTAKPYLNEQTNGPGVVLGTLRSLAVNNPYWPSYLDKSDYDNVWRAAWSRLLPLRSSVTPRLTLTLASGTLDDFVEVRIKPEILIHPAGWIFSISLQVVGPHNLETLRKIVIAATQEVAFSVENAARPMKLRALGDYMANGMRADVVGTMQRRHEQDVLRLITVTRATEDAYLSWGGSDHATREALSDIVWPDRGGLALQDEPKERRQQANNFILQHPFGRFMWIGPLIARHGPKSFNLDCYHHNTWHSLLLAWLHSGVMDAALSPAASNPGLLTLAKYNAPLYQEPQLWFRNVSLRRFAEDHKLADKAKRVLAAPASAPGPAEPRAE